MNHFFLSKNIPNKFWIKNWNQNLWQSKNSRKKIKHTELCEKEKNSRKKEKSKSLNQYFLSKNIMNAENGKKEIGVKIRKQNFQKHILHKKLESRFVGEKKEHKNIWTQSFGYKHLC